MRIPWIKHTFGIRHTARQTLTQIPPTRAVQMKAELLALLPQFGQKPLERAEMAKRHIDVDLHVVGEIDRAVRALPHAQAVAPERGRGDLRQRVGARTGTAYHLLRQFQAERS